MIIQEFIPSGSDSPVRSIRFYFAKCGYTIVARIVIEDNNAVIESSWIAVRPKTVTAKLLKQFPQLESVEIVTRGLY